MGYACPVCDEHVPNAEHLADHLAFAAVTGDDAHESWLDEHAPGWETGGTEELAPRVTEHAETVEFEVDTHPAGEHGHDHGGGSGARGGGAGAGSGAGALDAEAQRILEEAAEMTREMQRDGDGAEDDSGATTSEDETE
ncbi:hypothetical protein J2752_001839 [Halarchaeum rubridurum]|uniref:Uncharacterized protein n=1 Tax=Halarchaeum rubridurum TaxID=489911 RepID=A0A830G150_9EURY|nr:DUF5810 domain-containing protein [Halarchaeum rubridurum]MBP1954927.1 hypothetical protein [Halarchaeum rubridurum]GGM70294.1 hypothetical protein GCM10009017_20630 [Halarchaeum rubridurum]